MTDLAVRAFGGDRAVDRQAVTSEEIRDQVAAQSSYTPEQRQIIDGARQVADRTLRQVVLPRSRVVGLPAELDVTAALDRLSRSGHSRAPVFTHDLDDADRTISVLGLVGRTGTVGDHARPALALPESLNAVAALRELQAERQQLALVVSEHGGVEGIITVEDLLEELVGEIYDEHDHDVRAVVHEPDGRMVVPGGFPLHDLDDLGVEVASEEVTTVGGLVAEHLGRIPRAGDHVVVDGIDFEVLGVRRRAAERVRIRPQPGWSGPSGNASPPTSASSP